MLRRRTTFLAGIAVGIVAGAKVGRDRYEQLMKYVRKVTDNPSVRKATQAATQKAGELTKATAHQAAEKLPGLAESAKETAKASAGKVRSQFGHNHADAEPDTAAVNGSQPYS